MTRMPGESFRGPLPAPTEAQRALAADLRRDVEALADDFAGRSMLNPDALEGAARHVEHRLEASGFEPRRQTYELARMAGESSNIEAELRGTGRPDEIVVVGAHYDVYMGQPGADDNASGVAGVLALADRLAGAELDRTVRFVLFTNEEPPHFWTRDMGSRVYARLARVREDDVAAMLSLEMIGYYSDEPRSQRYPPPLGLAYPNVGDFIAFVGNHGSRALVRRAIASFREHAAFPSEGGAVPGFIPGVAFSDHWSFWIEGYRAIMITDTAMYRNPHYHTMQDTPGTLDYERMARVVEGLEHVVRDLARTD